MAQSTIKVERTTRIGIGGNWPTVGRNDGAVSINVPIPGIKANGFALSKVSGIAASIYGSKASTGCTLTFDSSASVISEDGHLFLKFTPSVTVSNYTDTAKIFMLTIEDPLVITFT